MRAGPRPDVLLESNLRGDGGTAHRVATSGTLSHNWRSCFLVESHSAAEPLDCLLHTSAGERTAWKHSAVSDIAALLALEHSSHKAFFDAHYLDTVFPILLVGQYQNGYAAGILIGQDTLEHKLAFVQPADVFIGGGPRQVGQSGVADVAAVDDEDDGMATAVVALPEPT